MTDTLADAADRDSPAASSPGKLAEGLQSNHLELTLGPPPIFVETRIVGKKARPLDGWSIPLPPDPRESHGDGLTLRELITRVVHGEVSAFEKRERVRRFVRVLSDREIDAGAAKGKIDPGGRAPTGPVDPDAAVASALQGFEDGLYVVILDGNEQRELDKQIYITAESRMVFLRLTFLAGA